MAHQRPKSAEQDSYSYTLEHEVHALIQELAQQERKELNLQQLTPSNYLTRLIRKEAAERLDEASRARAKAAHEEKLARRLGGEGTEDQTNPKRKRGPKAKTSEEQPAKAS